MPPQPSVAPPAAPEAGVTFDTFSGLKNTVAPENLTARELSRAVNVDLDDLGALHRRRGRRLVASGPWHSIFSTTAPDLTFGVNYGILVLLNPDYSVVPMLSGIADERLAWVQVGPTAYFSSKYNSGQIDLFAVTQGAALQGAVQPWGRLRDPSYQPGLAPGPADFWFSPVVRPEDGLPPVGGRLLGAPPLGSHLTYHNGRIYVAEDRTLWATELYLYNYVDKTKNYRLFEDEITGLAAVEDGVYVGTRSALWFLSGPFGEHVRTRREKAGVVPGSMFLVPGELLDPEGRRFPDLPRQTSDGMICMTDAGAVVGLAGGQTYNLTQTGFVFPKAVRAAGFFRREDGMGTVVQALDSAGTPADGARFGDYISAILIRAGTPGQPGTSPAAPVPAFVPIDPAIQPVVNPPGTLLE